MFPAVSKTCVSILLAMTCEPVLAQHIVAHRGASHDAPENTLAAIRLAWEQGADGVEADFYLSSDRQVVCIHDKDTQRVAGQKLVVNETPLEVLRQLDVGSWKGEKWQGQQVPTLSEVLAEVPAGKMIVIELKVGPEIVNPVAAAIESSAMSPEQILIISFHEETIAACEKQLPELKTHWLTDYKEQEDGSVTPTVESVIATLGQIHADGFGSQARVDHVDEAFIERLKQCGHGEFHVWTVNDVEVARYYQRLGAWSITTDRPGWLREQLAETP